MASLLSDCYLSCYSGRSSSKIGANGVLTFREILKKMEILKGIWMDPVTNSTSILQSISASLFLWMAARLVWDIWRKWWYSVQIWWFIGDLKKYAKTMMKESFSSREHKRCEINHSNSEYQIHNVSNCRLDRNFLTCIEYAVWFTVHNPLLWTLNNVSSDQKSWL